MTLGNGSPPVHRVAQGICGSPILVLQPSSQGYVSPEPPGSMRPFGWFHGSPPGRCRRQHGAPAVVSAAGFDVGTCAAPDSTRNTRGAAAGLPREPPPGRSVVMSRRRFCGGACVATGTRPAGRGSAGRLLLPGRGDDRAGFRGTQQGRPGRGARDTCRRRAGRGRAVRAAWAGGRLPRHPRHRGPEVHTVGAAGARLLQRLAADARGWRHGRGGGQWRGRQPAVRGPGDGRTGSGRGHRRRRTAAARTAWGTARQ